MADDEMNYASNPPGEGGEMNSPADTGQATASVDDTLVGASLAPDAGAVTEDQPAREAPGRKSTGKPTLLLAIGALVVVALLAGAAFMGARLIGNAGQQTAGAGSGGGLMIKGSGVGGKGAFSKRVEIEPAPELPARPSEIAGVFTRLEGNSLFLGTGKVSMMVKKDAAGGTSAAASYDGPIVEVVVTHDTQIFADVTPMMNVKGAPEEKIEQVVRPGTLDDLDKNTLVSVWGERNGDRVIADVLTYSLPGG